MFFLGRNSVFGLLCTLELKNLKKLIPKNPFFPALLNIVDVAHAIMQ